MLWHCIESRWRLSATYIEWQKNREKGHERERDSVWQELEGDSLVKRNKVKEETWKEWKLVKCEKSGVWKRVEYTEKMSSNPEYHPQLCHIWEKEQLAFEGAFAYGLSELSRQVSSMPGNDVMVSTSWLELGFRFLWSQKGKTSSQP